MNNTTLFRKTAKIRENSHDSRINAIKLRRPNTGIHSKPNLVKSSDQESITGAIQNMYSSFGSNFPFFSTENLKEGMETEKSNSSTIPGRAKTPCVGNNTSERFGRVTSMSPKGILKKPNTAQIGRRKHVHYNLKLRKKGTSILELNNPPMDDISQSSYFAQ